MKTFKRKVSCEDCYLSTYSTFGGCMCTTLGGKSLFECPGAITDKTVRKAQAAALKARPEAGPEQLTKTKAELAQLLSEAKLLVLQLKSAKLQMEDESSQANERRMKWQDLSKGGFVNAEKEQTLGTVAEPAEPPPASAQQPKNGMAKMKVRIAMNLDLIAEYFSLVNDFLAKEKEMDEFSADYCRLTKLLREIFPSGYHPADVQLDAIFSAGFAQAKEQWETAAEKKSALEAKIMEKLMAK